MLVAIDIETTGLNRKECGICQLSMVKVDDDFNVIDEFNAYIHPRPGARWSESAMNVTGITPKKVENCPTLKVIADDVLNFIGDCDILTYNGNVFDLPWLQEELKMCGRKLILSTRKIYDSYYIETLINSKKLKDVYFRYTGEVLEGAHNSLMDTRATIEVFKHQLNKIKKEDCQSEINFGGTVGRDDNTGERIFLIGKYRGCNVTEVIKNDPDWIAWLIKEKQDNDFFLFIKGEWAKLKSMSK